ncbi:MAG: hypothetical protein AB7F40_04335 [Victivallaceae bacterium]
MAAFGWTIEYTLSLPWPVFMSMFGLIRRVRMDNAIDSMYTPYCAAKYGGTASRFLFDGRGSYHLEDDVKPPSEKALKLAHRKIMRIIRAREKMMADEAGR